MDLIRHYWLICVFFFDVGATKYLGLVSSFSKLNG